MSNLPAKHARDNSLNFKGFLNDLQGWEHSSIKDKDKKSIPHKGNSKAELVSEGKLPVESSAAKSLSSSQRQYRPPMSYDPLSQLSSSLMSEDSSVDAASEKDQGNEFFKKRKFNEAIDCYSRSIALSPTAVAYANRAMAYLKIRRFKEAEDDCTEALNLDDRYIKAYSRRATARKELGKLRDSLEDIEFALRLEPQTEELKKQRAEVKSLLEKAILAKAAGTMRKPTQGVKEVENKGDPHGHEKRALPVAGGSKKAGVDILSDTQVFVDKSSESGKMSDNKTRQQVNGLHKAAPNNSYVKKNKASKVLETSVQELASRAASRAMAEAAKNITTPNSAYQFEVCWRGFSGDRSLQSRLLKVTPPDALPQIFKNALTAPLLVDVIRCLATLFTEDTELVVKYIENLIKIPRFDMIIMCLPSEDKADLCRIWNDVFLSKAAPIEYSESLSELHPRYCLQ